MVNKRIEELKRRITEYVNDGGNIYSPKRQLPYYDYLTDTVKAIKKKTGKVVSVEDVYEMCGIKFDRDYNHFNKFLKKLTPHVKGGYADEIRTAEARKVTNVYEMLKNYADKYDTTPFDFLVLMTGFKFENCYAKGNYIGNLKNEILAVYPNGNISGIRWEYPHLYEKLRQLQKYLPSAKSVKDAVEFLGLRNTSMTDKSTNKESTIKVVEGLKELYPDGKVVDLRKKDIALYNRVVRCCRQENLSTIEWFSANGFSYSVGQVHPRLNLTKVDADKRAEMLCSLKDKALEKIKLDKFDEVELFRASLKATKMVIDELNHEQIKADLKQQLELN